MPKTYRHPLRVYIQINPYFCNILLIIIMKDKTLKNIRLCCYIALIFCIIWAGLVAKYLIIDVFGCSASPHSVDWSVNSVMKSIVLVCYLLGTVAMITLCIKAILNTFRGIRENTVFPKSNVKLMFWIALAEFIHLLGFGNLPVLWKEDVIIQFQHTNFVTPFFLLFFAFMYKVAADAVEENNLTV